MGEVGLFLISDIDNYGQVLVNRIWDFQRQQNEFPNFNPVSYSFDGQKRENCEKSDFQVSNNISLLQSCSDQ